MLSLEDIEIIFGANFNISYLQDVEDEYHFILICPAYSNIRINLLKPLYYKKKPVFINCVDYLQVIEIQF